MNAEESIPAYFVTGRLLQRDLGERDFEWFLLKDEDRGYSEARFQREVCGMKPTQRNQVLVL